MKERIIIHWLGQWRESIRVESKILIERVWFSSSLKQLSQNNNRDLHSISGTTTTWSDLFFCYSDLFFFGTNFFQTIPSLTSTNNKIQYYFIMNLVNDWLIQCIRFINLFLFLFYHNLFSIQFLSIIKLPIFFFSFVCNIIVIDDDLLRNQPCFLF